MTYQIRDWSEHFENNRSRQREKCSFVCVPNKQSGMGFCRITAEPDGAAIYGIWHMILGACSQQKHRDGWLTADGHSAGTAWSLADLALKFRRPEKEIERALQVLCSEKVGWMICHKCPPSDRVVTFECPSGALKEEKEEKRKKEENGASFSETPSWNEFFAYCQIHGGPVEWYARDKFLAAEADGWKGKTRWQFYADRIRQWWENEKRPMNPPGPTRKAEEKESPWGKTCL